MPRWPSFFHTAAAGAAEYPGGCVRCSHHYCCKQRLAESLMVAGHNLPSHNPFGLIWTSASPPRIGPQYVGFNYLLAFHEDAVTI